MSGLDKRKSIMCHKIHHTGTLSEVDGYKREMEAIKKSYKIYTYSYLIFFYTFITPLRRENFLSTNFLNKT